MIAPLKQQVEARDRLVQEAEQAGQQLGGELLAALARGDIAAAEAAARRQQVVVTELAENLRIYQGELHAQADELLRSQARTEELLDRFATLFGHVPVAVLMVAPNGEVLETNLMAEQLFGPAGRHGVRFLHRLVEERAFQRLVRPALLATPVGGHRAIESIQFIGEGGQRFIGELHVARLRDAATAEGAFVCVVVDRSVHLGQLRALRMAIEAKRQSEAFLTDTARLARTGGWELTFNPRLLRTSPQLLSLLGLAPEAAARIDSLLALCEGESRRRWTEALARAESEGEPFDLELDMRCADDHRPMRVRVVGRPVRGEIDGTQADAAVTQVLGVLQDITAQQAVQRALSDVSQRLAVAAEAGGLGVWECDLAHGRVVVDERMARLFDLPAAAAFDGTLAGVLAPALDAESAELLAQALQQAMQGDQPLRLELRRASPAPAAGAGREPPAGGERWVTLAGRSSASADGRGVRLVGCAWDSTLQHEALRLKLAHDAADGASRAKSAFLSRMSHELRTPLNAILGFSQLMSLEAAAGDLVLKPHRVELIESAARHLLDLVNEVLDVSNIEAGRMELRMARCDLREVVRESLPMVQQPAEAMAVELRDTLAGGPPVWVWGDRLRLRELVINLVSNGIKYNRRGGTVTLHAAVLADAVELHVTDSGRGMTPQQVEQLFQPFNRLGAEALGIEGSGMGLFVCHRFAQLMGGRLHLSSQAGHGTTAVVRLQVPPSPAGPEDGGPAPSEPGVGEGAPPAGPR